MVYGVPAGYTDPRRTTCDHCGRRILETAITICSPVNGGKFPESFIRTVLCKRDDCDGHKVIGKRQ